MIVEPPSARNIPNLMVIRNDKARLENDHNKLLAVNSIESMDTSEYPGFEKPFHV
jgi:hypothetical protein